MDDSNLTQPTNKEITLSSKDLKKKPNRLKTISLLLIPILIIVVALFIYYFYFKANITYIDNNIVNTVLGNSITKEEAEAKNLAQQIQRINTMRGVSKITLVRDSGTSKEQNMSYSRLSLEIDSNGTINKKDIQVEGMDFYTEVFFLTSDTIKNITVDSDIVAKNIIDYISKNKIYNFALDVSLTYLENYMSLIERVSSELENSSFSIFLYPKWGNEVDYSHFATITNDFHKTMNLEDISKLVSSIYVMSYNYTGPQDILPGPVTPSWWFERIIQYYISSGVPREKLKMGINNSAYEWKRREIETNPIMNYSLLNQEANEILRNDFEDFIEENNLKSSNITHIEEDLYNYTKDDVEYITIIPSDVQIQRLEDIVSSYGLTSLFYK
jgi:hypothetical protein